MPPLDRLVLDVRLPFDPDDVRAFSPDGGLVASAGPAPSDGGVRLILRQVPVYGIVSLLQRS